MSGCGREQGPEAALRRVRELTALFSMEPLLDKPLVTLSSGELRKYQLTRALLGGPEILVVDNPYIGLDPRTRALLTGLRFRRGRVIRGEKIKDKK